MKTRIIAAVLALALPGLAQAAPVTFFGEDLNPGASVPAGGNAETARNNFISNLAPGVGVEDFEEPTVLPNILFPVSSGDVNAQLTGGAAAISSLVPSSGRFATSGSNFVEVDGGGGFNIAFSTAISAFGFYGTDIGDFGGSLSITLTDSNGGTTDIDIPNTVGAADGSLLFFGFYDLTETYTNIEFFNSSGSDFFGFDDMIVGDQEQITPRVPLPAAGWMLLAGLGGLRVAKRRKKA